MHQLFGGLIQPLKYRFPFLINSVVFRNGSDRPGDSNFFTKGFEAIITTAGQGAEDGVAITGANRYFRDENLPVQHIGDDLQPQWIFGPAAHGHYFMHWQAVFRQQVKMLGDRVADALQCRPV